MKNDYEIRGVCTAIFLKRRDGTIFETYIDTEDLPKVLEYKHTWHLHEKRGLRYIRGYKKVGYRNYTSIWLHRYVVDAPQDYVVDHINHDTLDNRKYNLRVATNMQNMQNRIKPTIRNKSGTLGVYQLKRNGKWKGGITINYKRHFTKEYDDVEMAKYALESLRLSLVSNK